MYGAADEIPTDSLPAASFPVAGLIGAMEVAYITSFARITTQRKQNMAIYPKATALLLIVKPVMESTNMLANTVQAAAKARAAGVAVMFAPISFAEGY